MNRFLSNATNRVDAKGRVSVPASFRAVLTRLEVSELYCLQDFVFPAINIGGPDLLSQYETQIEALDPFSEEANRLSLLVHGGGIFMKLDGEGRLMVSDFIRSYTGIMDAATFVGRGRYFQLWEPETFQEKASAARRERARGGALSAR